MCGLVHSIFDTVPVTLNGASRSNSAANEWCALNGTAAMIAARARLTKLDFIGDSFAIGISSSIYQARSVCQEILHEVPSQSALYVTRNGSALLLNLRCQGDRAGFSKMGLCRLGSGSL